MKRLNSPLKLLLLPGGLTPTLAPAQFLYDGSLAAGTVIAGATPPLRRARQRGWRCTLPAPMSRGLWTTTLSAQPPLH